MSLISKRKVKSQLLDTSGRATLLGVLVCSLLVLGFQLLLQNPAQAFVAKTNTTTSCFSAGACHFTPSSNATITTAVKGVVGTTAYVKPSTSFEIDWIYSNIKGSDNSDAPIIAIPTAWTIAAGTANSPGFITPAWNTVWDAADGVTSTTGGGTSNSSGIAGWNTTFADSFLGTGLKGYTINYPTATGNGTVWGGTGGSNTNGAAADDGGTLDKDGVPNRMGADAMITVGSTAGQYSVDVYGIGHDTNTKTYVKQTITVYVDNTFPTITAFTMPSTSTSTSVALTGLNVSDNYQLAGYLINESATEPSLSDPNWVAISGTSYNPSPSFPSYTFSGAGTRTAYLWVKDAAGNISTSASQTVTITLLAATTTTVSTPTAITYGQNASFTATVSPSAATGTVQFKVDGVNVGSAVTLSGGSATLANVTGLAAGSRSVTAVYSGDSTYAASTSSAVTQTVNQLAVTLTGSRTYDATASASSTILSVSNKVGSDTVTVASGSATLASANVGDQSISSMGTLTLGGVSAANYTLVGATGSVTISQKALTITASNRTKTYGQNVTFAGTEFASSGLAGSDSISSVTLSSSGAAATANVAGSPYTITPSAAVFGVGSASNYSITYATGTLTVNPLAVILTGSRAYDATTSASSSILSITNIQGADIVTVASGSATLVDANVGIQSISSMGTLTLSGDSAANYTLVGATGSVTISQKALTVTASNLTKTYGQAVTFAGTEFASSGLAGSDSISSVTLSSSGAAATATVAGSPYTITPSAAVFGVGSASNYSITYAIGTLTVNPLAVILTGSRAYDATTSASYSILSVTNIQGTDSVTLASGSATLAAADVGAQSIVSMGTLTLGGDSATNYTLIGATGSVTISKANPSVTAWPTASNITYGQTLASSTLTGGTALVSGTFAFTSPSTAPSAGTAAQGVTFTPTDSTNYNSVSGTVDVTVNKALQTITFPAPTISKTYGAADFSSIATTSSLLAVSYSSDNSAVATIDPLTGLVHIVGAGTANLTANLAGDSNYDPASAQTALTVDKAILTVSANDANRVYGAANPAFTPKYSGFVYGETIAVLSGAPELTTSATTGSLAGSYPINAALGTLSADNYSFSFGSGTLAIDIASQSIIFNPLGSKTYGAAAFDLSATGGASGNPVTFESSDLSVATISGNTVTIVGAGTTSITAMQAGTVGAYASATAQQSLTIDKATLSVSAQSVSRSYGVANPIFTPLYSGFAYSDTSAVLIGAPDLSTTATIFSPVGSYPITASIGTLSAANYSFTFSPGTLGIDQAVQTISFAALPVKSYGDTTFDLSATGGDSGNPVTFSSSNLAVATISGSTVTIVGAGSADITASQDGNSNYTSATALQTLTVNKAVLSVSSQPASRTYGAANPTLLPAYTGFVYSDTAAVLQGAPALSTTANATSPVGSYPVTVTAGNLFSGNYSFSFADGNLSVTQAAITVTADNATRPYGAADPVFTASYSGFVNGETVAVVSGQPTFSTTATIDSPAGTYPIYPASGTLSAVNYSFVMQPGTLTITQVATSATLTVTLSGTGGGAVNSSPTGIACASGSSAGCSNTFNYGTPVTLTAVPDWKSLFSGWGVPCSGTGSCLITLNGDAGVSAIFTVNGQATVLGHTITEYGSLQDAYNAASQGNIIAAHIYTFIESLTLNLPISVVFDLGKGDMYLSTTGYSTLRGTLTIAQGSATIKNLIIE